MSVAVDEWGNRGSIHTELAAALFQRIITTERRVERWKRELAVQVAKLSQKKRLLTLN